MNPIASVWASLKAAAGWTMHWSGLGGGFGPWGTWNGTNGWSSLNVGATGRDWAREVGDGSTNAAVVACVKAIQRAFPEAPMQVVTRNGQDELKPVPDHAMMALLEKPNDHYSGPHLWAATVADFAIQGNAYWLKVRSGGNRVAELWWVPSTAMEPRWPSDGSTFISHYDYIINGQVFQVDPADVVHFRDGFDPNNVRKGLSPIHALVREIATDNEAANWSASLLRNMGVPGVVISPDGDVNPSEADLEDVKTKFMQRFGGDNRGAPLVMKGPSRVTVLSFSPEQMRMTELRRVPEERISAALGVPAIVAGLGVGLDHATYSNVAQAREAFYEQSLIPMQRLLAAEIQTQLVPDFGDPAKLRVRFDLSEVRVLQADQNELHARARADLLAGGITRNQFLEVIGEEPVDGPEGDVLYVPNTVTVTHIDDLLVPPPPPPTIVTLPPNGQQSPSAALPAPTDGPPPTPADAAGAAQPAKAQQSTETKALSDADILARYEDGLTPLTETLKADLFDAFEVIVDAAAGRVAAHLGKGQANGHAAVAVEVKAEAIAGLVTDADHAEIRSLLRSYVLKSMRSAADGLAPLTGDKPVRITRNMPAVKAAIADMESRLPGIVETTGEDFGRLVRRLERRPGSVPLADVQQALKDYVAETYPGRTEKIARTELGYGHAAGVLLVAEKSGIAGRVHVHDGTGDGPCAERNGAVLTLDEARGEALLHPNCTLRLIPVVETA